MCVDVSCVRKKKLRIQKNPNKLVLTGSKYPKILPPKICIFEERPKHFQAVQLRFQIFWDYVPR